MALKITNRPKPRERIEAIGFRQCGNWLLNQSGEVALDLPELGDRANILYAFVCGDDVMYVGKTTIKLQRRLYGYRKPSSTQSTNQRGHKAINEALQASKTVSVFALPDDGLMTYGGFHMNMAAALEDDLIRKLSPPWNKRLGAKD